MLFVLKPNPHQQIGRRISSNPTGTSPTLDTKPCVTHQYQVGASALVGSARPAIRPCHPPTRR